MIPILPLYNPCICILQDVITLKIDMPLYIKKCSILVNNTNLNSYLYKCSKNNWGLKSAELKVVFWLWEGILFACSVVFDDERELQKANAFGY